MKKNDYNRLEEILDAILLGILLGILLALIFSLGNLIVGILAML